MTVNAPPNVTRPAFRPSQKISAVSDTVRVPVATASTRAGASENERALSVRRRALVHSSYASPAPSRTSAKPADPKAVRTNAATAIRASGTSVTKARERRTSARASSAPTAAFSP
jgi:hypothetical protein